MQGLPGYSSQYAQALPPADATAITRVHAPVLVQVVDALDVHTSVSAQLDALYAARDKIIRDGGEPDESQTPVSKFSKYTVEDSSGNKMFLIYHTPPQSLPEIGSYLVLDNTEVHRGILIGMEHTAQNINRRRSVPLPDRIAYLEALLSPRATTTR